MSRFLTAAVLLTAAATARGQGPPTVLFDANGFEPTGSPQTYTTGNLIGQNGFQQLTAAGATASYLVQNTVVASGTQAVSVSSPAAGTNFAFPTPPFQLTPGPNEQIFVRSAIARGAATSGAVAIDVFNNAASDRTFRFGLLPGSTATTFRPFAESFFNSAGQPDPNGTRGPLPIGSAEFAANTFVNFEARLDYAAKTARLLINGADTGFAFPFADPTANDFGDAELQLDAPDANSGIGYFDNYQVLLVPVPEPTTVGLVAAAGLLAGRRLARRRA